MTMELIERVKYVAVHVRDIEAARGFYGRALSRPERAFNPHDRAVEYLLPGGVVLILHQFNEEDDCFPGGRPAGTVTGISFGVTDVFRAAAHWEAQGGKITMEPAKLPCGETVIAVADPDGNEYFLNQ